MAKFVDLVMAAFLVHKQGEAILTLVREGSYHHSIQALHVNAHKVKLSQNIFLS